MTAPDGLSDLSPEKVVPTAVLPVTEPESGAPHSRVSPRRLNWALFIVGVGWVFANAAVTSVLLAAKIKELAPDDKVFYLGLTTALAGVGTTLALFTWGAVSDLTRSRFGRRAPWIVFGGLSGAVLLTVVSQADTLPVLIAAFALYGLLFNALPAAVSAVFPDRVPESKLGAVSGIYGAAQVIGGALAAIISSQFVSNPSPMLLAASVVLLAAALAFVALAPDHPSNVEERETENLLRLVLASMRFPRSAPDFYWVFAGRFLLILGMGTVQSFSLYLLTDYIGLSDDEAGRVLAISGGASLVSLLIGSLVAGPLSDRLGQRRLPVFLAAVLFGVAVLFPFFWPTGAGMIVFGAVSGLGLGAFLAVDAALMTEVLPDAHNRGRDLGILNTANTVPGIIAPLLTAGVVSAGFGYRPVFLMSLTLILIGAFSIFKVKSVR